MPYYFYAEKPTRRLRQVFMDLSVVVWSWWWISVGMKVYSHINGIGTLNGGRIEHMGKDVVSRANDTAGTAAGVPFVGGKLADQLRKLTGVGDQVQTMGGDLRDQMHQLGLIMGIVVAILPILLVLMLWLPHRLRYALQETRTIPRDRTTPEAIERLALKALVNCDASRISRVHPKAMQGWRDADPEIMQGLAALELERVGLKMKGPRAVKKAS